MNNMCYVFAPEQLIFLFHQKNDMQFQHDVL